MDGIIDTTVTRKYGGYCLSETVELSIEQRRKPRYRLHSAVNVAFYNHGKLFRGYMTDLSIGGARILLPADVPDDIPDLSTGRRMECYILNRHGSSKCRGTVRWIRYDGYLLKWGISFVELSAEKNDPFRTTIDKVCCRCEFSRVAKTAVY